MRFFLNAGGFLTQMKHNKHDKTKKKGELQHNTTPNKMK